MDTTATTDQEYTTPTESDSEATTTPATTPPTELPDVLFRLVDANGEDVAEGERGLLLYRGGTVCDDQFDDADARVICRELGYTNDSTAFQWGSADGGQAPDRYESYRYTIKLTNVQCADNSNSWDSCDYETRHNCNHYEDVVLDCDTGNCGLNDWRKGGREGGMREG